MRFIRWVSYFGKCILKLLHIVMILLQRLRRQIFLKLTDIRKLPFQNQVQKIPKKFAEFLMLFCFPSSKSHWTMFAYWSKCTHYNSDFFEQFERFKWEWGSHHSRSDVWKRRYIFWFTKCILISLSLFCSQARLMKQLHVTTKRLRHTRMSQLLCCGDMLWDQLLKQIQLRGDWRNRKSSIDCLQFKNPDVSDLWQSKLNFDSDFQNTLFSFIFQISIYLNQAKRTKGIDEKKEMLQQAKIHYAKAQQLIPFEPDFDGDVMVNLGDLDMKLEEVDELLK